MNLFDVILARKIEAKHGGGSGDCHEFTITNAGVSDAVVLAAFKIDEPGYDGTDIKWEATTGTSATAFYRGPNGTSVYIVKEKANDELTVDGNAQIFGDVDLNIDGTVTAFGIEVHGDFSFEYTAL